MAQEVTSHLCCQGTAGSCPARCPPGPGDFLQNCSSSRLAPAYVADRACPPQEGSAFGLAECHWALGGLFPQPFYDLSGQCIHYTVENFFSFSSLDSSNDLSSCVFLLSWRPLSSSRWPLHSRYFPTFTRFCCLWDYISWHLWGHEVFSAVSKCFLSYLLWYEGDSLSWCNIYLDKR